ECARAVSKKDNRIQGYLEPRSLSRIVTASRPSSSCYEDMSADAGSAGALAPESGWVVCTMPDEIAPKSEDSPQEDLRQVLFVRHGKSQQNQNNDRFGETAVPVTKLFNWLLDVNESDPSLTREGVLQALRARERKRELLQTVDLVMVSPLLRAIETAYLLLGKDWPTSTKPITVTPLAREVSSTPGDVGHTYSELWGAENVLRRNLKDVVVDEQETDEALAFIRSWDWSALEKSPDECWWNNALTHDRTQELEKVFGVGSLGFHFTTGLKKRGERFLAAVEAKFLDLEGAKTSHCSHRILIIGHSGFTKFLTGTKPENLAFIERSLESTKRHLGQVEDSQQEILRRPSEASGSPLTRGLEVFTLF
ncbi:hypothetical protein CYMTET_39651, partial [Cymbomonas tetramitiformis]